MDFEVFCETTFKWTYLGAQKELVGQMVVVTEYFGPVLHAEQVSRAIGGLQIRFLGLVSFSLYFCNTQGYHLMISSE